MSVWLCMCRGTYWWVRVLTSVAAFTPPSITRSQSCDYPAKIDLVHMRSSGILHNVHALLTGHLDTLEANDSPALVWYDYLIVNFVSLVEGLRSKGVAQNLQAEHFMVLSVRFWKGYRGSTSLLHLALSKRVIWSSMPFPAT